MKWQKYFVASWRSALAGSVLCAGFGVLLLSLGSTRFSYDLLFLNPLRNTAPPEVVIVQMDDRSYNEMQQDSLGYWDIKEHAKLLDRLTAEGASLVVFDVVFTSPGFTATDKAIFAGSIRTNGHVVLATALDTEARAGIGVDSLIKPWPEIAEAAARLGVAEVRSPRGEVVRQYYRGDDQRDSLPWAGAKVAGLRVTKRPNAQPPDTWLNYYGPAETLHRISYCDVGRSGPGFFSGKYVFVGTQPKTLKAFEEADVFRTPHSVFGGELFPGVEIGATAFLNLLREDGLYELSKPKQYLLIVILGSIFGAALSLLRPLPACCLAMLGVLGLIITAFEVADHHVWFAWAVIAFGQIPAGIAWSLRCHYVRLSREKERVEWKLSEATRREEASRISPPVVAEAVSPRQPSDEIVIPDHTMVRRVGKGAYGEVWLARNAIGAYHAVKIVRRRGFPADEPYEREFRGIQKFMPISRSHPGFVHLLHVGRNDTDRFFFCIMEAGDDVTSGQRIDPETYSPKTLSTELELRGMLPPKECLRLALALTLALDHLHQQKLIHRDIKPANIIYVNDQPKFADIGLVTDIRGDGRDVSYLGTEGYLAPEGPGTASADVFALGKVLYEACMGRDRCLFPEIPTAVLEAPAESLVRQLNQIIFKACEMAANERYQTAAEMHADLKKLESLASRSPL